MSTFEEQQQHNFVPFAQEPYVKESDSTAAQVNGLLSQMWHTRPVRIPSGQGGDAKIAGVCEGIGIRYQIDPILVRLAFVVSGFLGAGIAAYLLAWLVMPRYSVPVSPLEAIWKPGHPKDRTHGWWLLIFFIGFSGIFTSGATEIFGSVSFLTYILLGAMWWGLHKRMPIPPRGLLANGYDPTQDTTQDSAMNNQNPNYDPHSDAYPQPQPNLGGYSPAEGYSAPFAQQYQAPPSWDPLATNYNAWDTQITHHSQPTKKKRKVWPWVAVGFIGTGAAMVLFFGIFGAALSPVHFEEDSSGIGDVSLAPSNDELVDSYSSGVGEMDLNLTNLTPLEAERDINISSGVGEVNVVLPGNVPVNLTCSSGIGTTNCDIEDRNDGLEGEALNIHITSGIGDVDVAYADD